MGYKRGPDDGRPLVYMQAAATNRSCGAIRQSLVGLTSVIHRTSGSDVLLYSFKLKDASLCSKTQDWIAKDDTQVLSLGFSVHDFISTGRLSFCSSSLPYSLSWVLIVIVLVIVEATVTLLAVLLTGYWL